MNINIIATSDFYKPSFYGWQPKTARGKATVNQMADIIKGKNINSIAVSGHLLPDGDSFFSSIACASLLHEITNKNIDVYFFDKIHEQYKYIVENLEGIRIIEVNSDTPMNNKYDLCVSVDTSADNLIDENYYNHLFKQAKHTLKIDHHPDKVTNKHAGQINTNYADINYTDANCISASEVLMQFVKPLGLKPSKLPKIFTESVYCGILSDSAGFKFISNPIVFNDAHLLLTKGINHKKLSKTIFTENELPQSLKDLYNILMTKVRYSDNGKIGYFAVDDEISEYIKKAEDETDKVMVTNTMKKVIGQLLEKKGVEIGFYTRIIKEGNSAEKVAVSIRSNEIRINEVASKFGGGGHKNAAGLYGISKGKTAEEWKDDFLRELLPLTENTI